jgi:hypothetical protein
LLLLAAAAEASTITVFFTALPSTIEDGTYNGYSTATIGGLPGLVMCDDYEHETYMPSSSNLIYYYSTLTGPDPLQDVRFTQGNETQNYREAAVLLAGMNNALAAGQAAADDITNYQYALWNLFDPGGAPATTAQRDLQTLALNTVQTGGPTALEDYSRLMIYTPAAGYASNQEFLGLRAPAAVPEPSTAPVLSLILGVAFLCARRWR